MDNMQALRKHFILHGEWNTSLQAIKPFFPEILDIFQQEKMEYLHQMSSPILRSSVFAAFIGLIANDNALSNDYSKRAIEMEAHIIKWFSNYLDLDCNYCGSFTFTGTCTILQGIYAGRCYVKKVYPEAKQHVVLILSNAHYAYYKMSNLLQVPYEIVEIDTLQQRIAHHHQNQVGIVCIGCTYGKTSDLSHDSLQRVHDILSILELPYKPHIHLDAVSKWLFRGISVDDTDHSTVGNICRQFAVDINLADSIGIDVHKTGFVPYCSSIILYKDKARRTYPRINIPYMRQIKSFQGTETFETSRPAYCIYSVYQAIHTLTRQNYTQLAKQMVINTHHFVAICLELNIPVCTSLHGPVVLLVVTEEMDVNLVIEHVKKELDIVISFYSKGDQQWLRFVLFNPFISMDKLRQIATFLAEHYYN